MSIKGGDIAWIVWGRGTALLLPRYLRGRETGPLFCSERRPGPRRKAPTASRALCPETGRMRLGYDRARALIKHYTGLQLHQLRHSAATHLEMSRIASGASFDKIRKPVLPATSPFGLDQGRLADGSSHPSGPGERSRRCIECHDIAADPVASRVR